MVSLLPRDAHVLILENGIYGERLSTLAKIYGIGHQVLSSKWGAKIELDELARLLAAGEITHVAAVHHETTTGRLNPVDEIAAICVQYKVQLLLDAVSSFGAESIPFADHSLQAIAATANKCLHGIPGLAIVLCRRDALKQGIEPRSMSLCLPAWSEHQAKRSTPFTPSVNAMLGLAKALQELHEMGGWKARRTRYRKLATELALILAKLGIEPWLPGRESSCVLRSYHLPAGMSYDELHDGLKQHGFIIYAGQGKLAEHLFRVSTMGEISDYDMASLEQAFQSVITTRD